MDVLGGGAGRPASPYSYVNRAARPTSALVPYSKAGAIVPAGGGSKGGFPSDEMMGPSATKSYEALTRLSGALRESNSFFNRTRLPLAGAVEELGAEFAQATKQVLLYGTAYKALAFVTDLPAQALNASKALQTFNNQLEAITGSAANADRSFAFVDGLATRFNVPLDSARQGFVKLYASMAPAGFSEEQIQNLFGGISKASATLGLSADKVDRVTYAFAQMASKGQLMAEEVTGQLGDVIPGALSIMADAAKMDIATFKKAMEDGAFVGKTFEQVMSNVPIVLEQRFGKGAIGAANTLQGALNSMTTATIKFYEAFEPVVSIAAANVFPLMAGVFNQATQAVKAFGASLQGSNGPANMLEGNALRIYTALQQFGQIGLAVANILKTLAPTFELVGRSILFTADLLARLINTPVGKFLAELITKAGLALIAFQLLARTGIGVLIGQLVILVRNLQLAGTGFAGLTAAIKGSALAARAFRLAITGLIAGGILMGLEALITQIGRVANRLGDARKKALEAASAIRSMSSAELVRERTLKQKDVALLQKVERQGGRIDTEAERKRLEELGLQTGTRGLQRMVMDPTMIPGIRQREEGLLAEVNYAYKNLDQAAVPMQLGDVDLSAGGDGKKEKDKAIKDASQLNRLIQQELEARNRLGLIGKDELSQIEEKAELAKEILALTLKDIRLTETGAIQTQSITNATLAYQVTVAELNEEWDKAIKKISEVEKEGRRLYKSILEQRDIEQSPLQKALVEIENQTEASIEKINELMSVLNAQAGLRPEGLAARAALGNMRSALQEQTPEQVNLRASQKITQPIRRDLESQLQGLLNAGKTLTTLDEIIIKIGEDWSALSPQIQGDLAELAGRIDAAKPFAEIASAIRESREELAKMTSTASIVISSANAISDAFGTAFKGVITGTLTAREALAGFFQSIADSFADMVAQMITEWLKAQLIKGFMSLFPGFGGAGVGLGDAASNLNKYAPLQPMANGGVLSGGFQAFANGGIVTGPTLGLVGEGRYNEAVVPLPDGKSVPVDLGGAAGNIQSSIIINIDGNGNAKSDASGSNASDFGRKIEGAVKQVIVNELRPGGVLAGGRR
jgi:tape measure domain-containing protein